MEHFVDYSPFSVVDREWLHFLVLHERGWLLYEVQDHEVEKRYNEWKEEGFDVRRVAWHRAEELAKRYTLNKVQGRTIRQVGGSEEYIPFDEIS